MDHPTRHTLSFVLQAALRDALQSRRPTLINVAIDPQAS